MNLLQPHAGGGAAIAAETLIVPLELLG